MTWRRSYDVPPPPLDDDAELSQFHDPRYADLPPELRPRTSSTRDPHTLKPSFINPLSARLNTFFVNHPGRLRSKCAAAALSLLVCAGPGAGPLAPAAAWGSPGMSDMAPTLLLGDGEERLDLPQGDVGGY